MLLVIRENPSVSDWLMAWRSIAWLAARRTRRSAHGDFGSHCSVKITQNVALNSEGFTARPGDRRSSSATAPRNV